METLRNAFSWFFDGGEEIRVFLTPADSAAKKLPGFHNGGLVVMARSGETVGAVMSRFNQFRGPDSQITTLYTQDGHIIPTSTVLNGSITCIVRAAA